MEGLIYPIHFHRRFERLWALRFNLQANTDHRRSPAKGTDVCVCSEVITAPHASSYAPSKVSNEWYCPSCGRRWTTEAHLENSDEAAK